ncbi:hypothetical protein HA402_006357 [Bradysia odoriphaga]|nr:hypothetical protein HA402_006357 [Bradysia odoriphaga]
MIGFRCVLILSLILSTTLVTGHSINRRDNQNADESGDEDDDKMKMLKSISDMLKISAQKLRGSVIMGYHLLRDRIAPDEVNRTSNNPSIGSASMDDDTIIFHNDDGPDVTAAMVTTIDEDNKDQQDATTIPTILNRSLLDTPIACGGGQQLGKDGKCRVVW